MGKRYDLLVFDWDGTLMDSAAAIVESLQAACVDLGLAAPSDEAARYIIGLGLQDALSTLVPELPEDDYSRLTDRYRFHYLSRDDRIPLFAGAAECIAELSERGFLLAVATGKSRKGLDRAFRQSGLGNYFHSSRCADECCSKPHPEMLQQLMTEFDVAPGRTLMIGDTIHDLNMAISAGVAGFAALYGAHPGESLLACSPVAHATTFAELHRWLIENA